MSDLVERVAKRIFASRTMWPWDSGPKGEVGIARHNARAAVSETLDEVERYLSAVQYEPAPYTALKYRLSQFRKENGL